MGILVPCSFLILVLLCTAIPGAAADPFDMPASFVGFEHLAQSEPVFTAAYGQIMDGLYDMVCAASHLAFACSTPSSPQRQSQSSTNSLPALSGTVRPTDTLFHAQFIEQHPHEFPTPPSSSGPSFYVPPQARPDTYPAMDIDSAGDVDIAYSRARPAQSLAPHLERSLAYAQQQYHPDDRVAAGRLEGSNATLEINSPTRRRPHIRGGYPCNVCGNSFNRQRDLNLHARTHNPQQNCPECDRRFVSRREVSRHVESVHRRSRAFSCDLCSSAFSRKDNLDRHVSTVHRGRRRQVIVHQ